MKKNKLFIFIFLFLTISIFSFNLTINAQKNSLLYINGQYILTMNNSTETINLPKGNYNIKLSKFGYTDYEVNIFLDKDMTINVSLLPLASIEFSSNLDYFYINIDENKKLISNGEIITIPTNVKKIILEAKGYKPLEININLNPFETKKINVNFIPENIVTFESTPNANLYINNTYVGVTPYSTILEANKYSIKLEKDGYLPIENSININPKDNPIIKFELKKGLQLNIDSSPQNALVIINGKKMGYTPNTFTVESGNLKIIVSKIGYISKELTINLDENNKQLFFELLEDYRLIKFQEYKDLSFYLDGKFIGDNVEYLELDGRPHIIEVLSKTEDLFFRYIIDKNSPRELFLNPKIYTSVEVLSNEKILTYIGDSYAFTPSTILINTMQKTKDIDVYYLNSKKRITIRKNKTQSIFLTDQENIGALSIFTSSLNALIYIDNKYINKGNVLGKVLESGLHKITFKFSSGEVYNIDINLNNFDHKVIFFSKANIVPVKIYNPKNYDVYIDDVKYTHSDLRLEFGVHKLSIFIGNKKIYEKYIYFTDNGKYIDLSNL
ncbi:PEGA domain-containing protein [Marinitoga sp. 38H-ov]|uniref:PEGA domain-containing protein n=1 Tax=Marinitoga sp. 38H-ov TaxID=1755814 RepID=UPI0013EB6246|nr:PEGA domain-containing protein [Marinitoga sp. 38H-ov]KAF2955342.1 hypothetical protein AS160_01210 [Marinitoga sp. 38H-ov]